MPARILLPALTVLSTHLVPQGAGEAPQSPEPSRLTRFTSLSRTFLIDLPEGWRQLAPNETAELAAIESTPTDWHSTAPRRFYAIGPVDRWLAGDVSTPWCYVVEQEEEWHVDGDFASELETSWRESGAESGERHEISNVERIPIGPLAHEVWRAERRTTDAAGRVIRSLDIYASTGGRQVTLTLRAWEKDFPRWRPEFDRWLSTLTFSRPSRGEQTLSDRLWTPALTGGVVGLVLLLLYKHTKRSR